MEAPTPIRFGSGNNQGILEKLECNKQSYELKIINSINDQNLVIKVEPKDIDICESYYQAKYKIEDLYKLNKYFRQFDAIEEVTMSLKNNDKIIKSKGNIQTYKIDFDNSSLNLKINLYLMSGQIQLINIKLDKIRRTEKEINDKLKEYIKYIKSIPGVKELIFSYENSSMFFPDKSNIITKIENFKFVYDELCKRMNKNKLTLVQKFNLTKDGSSSQVFHDKCDTIGPNISIIKTNNNLIFGGFTFNNWSYQTPNKKDDSSFIFNLQNKKNYPIMKGLNATYCEKNCLICFYNGTSSHGTIYIADKLGNCHTSPISASSYQNFSRDFELNNGSEGFSVSEIELYEIQ